jgi:hypothetical protein
MNLNKREFNKINMVRCKSDAAYYQTAQFSKVLNEVWHLPHYYWSFEFRIIDSYWLHYWFQCLKEVFLWSRLITLVHCRWVTKYILCPKFQHFLKMWVKCDTFSCDTELFHVLEISFPWGPFALPYASWSKRFKHFSSGHKIHMKQIITTPYTHCG